MDYDRTSLEWSERDFSNFTCQFPDEKTTIVTKLANEEGPPTLEVKTLSTNEEWETWLKNAVLDFLPSSGHPRSGICAVIFGSVEPIFDDDEDGANTQSPVSYLPFSSDDILSQLVHEFHLHPRITRTISRLSCYFSAQRHYSDDDDLPKGGKERRPMITCTARTSSTLPNDMALSTTYFTEIDLNLAVFYGCNERQKEDISRRIRSCDLKHNHPLLLPGLFFELERIRLVDQVENLLDNFELRNNYEYNQLEKVGGARGLDLDMDKKRMTDVLKSTYRSRELVSLIMAVKRQLKKFETAMDMVETSVKSSPSSAFSSGCLTRTPSATLSSAPGSRTMSRSTTLEVNSEENYTQQGLPRLSGVSGYLRLQRAGRMIRERLQDIMFEFDDKINDCHLVKDNMSLTMQTVWSFFSLQDNQTNLKLSRLNTKLAHANTGLSEEMKKDSSQMRSIALLTMVFLPMSTVATIFSTNFFSWDAAEGQSVVSKYFWVFIVVAIALTCIVVGAWYTATCAKGRKGHRHCCIRLPFGALFGRKAGSTDDDLQPHRKSGRRVFEDEERGVSLDL
ncbi:uncharacterized protein B0T23DRAFT_381794 [Neurospora hispaniola]|uniref:Uncharacterized protein n=1 Tax=Neurospora hispaniola TaxID=588809 RepID=A0AAJ0I543_9PEZI|nr:hypothetical protein B0T23DRAFT_381794 [Neurospora hispaniola]